jgi:hypothetical protein
MLESKHKKLVVDKYSPKERKDIIASMKNHSYHGYNVGLKDCIRLCVMLR